MVTHNQLYQHQQTQSESTPPAAGLGISEEQVDLLNFLNSPSTSNDADDVRSTRKQRLIPSDNNSPSPLAAKRNYKRGTNNKDTLDNPRFAPPPVISTNQTPRVEYQINAEHEANYDIMPSYDKIRHSGHIMTRFSAVSLLTKKWRNNFWILYGSCLYFFRSKSDFDQWLLNPYLSRDGRASLVKRYLNFKDKDTKNFMLGKIGTKYYRKGGLMYHFKLDKYYTRGHAASLHLVGAFSSLNENDVIELHEILKCMFKLNTSPPTNMIQRYLAANSETHSAYSSSYPFSDGHNSTASAGF